jgi:hypothetical protein
MFNFRNVFSTNSRPLANAIFVIWEYQRNIKERKSINKFRFNCPLNLCLIAIKLNPMKVPRKINAIMYVVE